MCCALLATVAELLEQLRINVARGVWFGRIGSIEHTIDIQEDEPHGRKRDSFGTNSCFFGATAFFFG
jgi:hypothetical protein